MGILKASQKRTKRRCFVGGVYIKDTRQVGRLLRHYANGTASHACETYDYIGGKEPLYFHEIAVIHNSEDDVLHVVGFDWVIGDHLAQYLIRTS